MDYSKLKAKIAAKEAIISIIDDKLNVDNDSLHNDFICDTTSLVERKESLNQLNYLLERRHKNKNDLNVLKSRQNVYLCEHNEDRHGRFKNYQ